MRLCLAAMILSSQHTRYMYKALRVTVLLLLRRHLLLKYSLMSVTSSRGRF